MLGAPAQRKPLNLYLLQKRGENVFHGSIQCHNYDDLISSKTLSFLEINKILKEKTCLISVSFVLV